KNQRAQNRSSGNGKGKNRSGAKSKAAGNPKPTSGGKKPRAAAQDSVVKSPSKPRKGSGGSAGESNVKGSKSRSKAQVAKVPSAKTNAPAKGKSILSSATAGVKKALAKFKKEK